MSIAAVTDPYDRTYYRLVLEVDKVFSPPVDVAAEPLYTMVTVSTTPYRVYWTDLGDEGYVNGGDAFLITGDAVPLGTGSYVLHVLWAADGSHIQAQPFEIP